MVKRQHSHQHSPIVRDALKRAGLNQAKAFKLSNGEVIEPGGVKASDDESARIEAMEDELDKLLSSMITVSRKLASLGVDAVTAKKLYTVRQVVQNLSPTVSK